jgi:4-carboxymuconolactone decarboxylase
MLKALLAGPRGPDNAVKPARGGKGANAAAAVAASMNNALHRGPFNAWLRSPDLGNRLQKVGEYIRFGSSVPLHLNEFAILITARYWTSQFEWFAHSAMALKAGLRPEIVAALANNKRPPGMQEDEAAVYRFCSQLHRRKKVGDKAYQRVVALFGEQGAMDLIGACGYYTLVSMTLNVAKVPVPAGHKKPLK